MKWLITLLLFISAHHALAERSPLYGVWQIQSTVYDGEAQAIRQPPQVKVFTDSHVFYTYYDPNLNTDEPYLSVGHGNYTLSEGNLSETIDNHSNGALIGQTFGVSIQLSEDGNTFEQEVDLGKYVLSERWVRIE